MYAGSWASLINTVPWACFLIVGLVVGPQGPGPFSNYLVVIAVFGVLFVTMPLATSVLFMLVYRTGSLVGTTVHLRIDDRGVRGWPIPWDADRLWLNMGDERTLLGVITLPFAVKSGIRKGWVAIPRRAFTADEYALFRLFHPARAAWYRQRSKGNVILAIIFAVVALGIVSAILVPK